MPTEATKRKARKAKAEGKSASTQAGEFVREEIERVRSGKSKVKVSSPEQAIAIGLSKARAAGVDVPEKRGTSRPARKRSSKAAVSHEALSEHAKKIAGGSKARTSTKKAAKSSSTRASTRKTTRKSPARSK